MDYLSLMGGLSQQLGISIILLVAMLIWSQVWKFIALWKSASSKSLVWFIIFALVNTMGILEILYIFVFSKMDKKLKVRARRAKRRR